MDDATVAQVIQQLRQHQALHHTHAQLHQLAIEAKSLLTTLPTGSARSALENLYKTIVIRST